MPCDSALSGFATQRRDFETARLHLARMQVSGGETLKKALAVITETAAHTLHVDRVGIWLYVHGRRAIRCYDLYQVDRQEHSEGAILDAADFPEYFQALETQRAIVAVEALADPQTRRLRDAYLTPLGITSMLDAPIFRGGEVIGVVCHEHIGPPRRWSREESDFAATVADSISLKFESAARQDAEQTKRALEIHLAESQTMEAVGRLAATIAHDFKNILTVVRAGSQLIARKKEATPEIQVLAQQILEAVERGNSLTTELMTFGRNQQRKTCVLDVAAMVEAMLPALRIAVEGKHTIAFQRDSAPGLVLIDRGQLERVVLNLVLNAKDALPSGGPINLSVCETPVADGGETGVYVAIEVADQGVGMTPETRQKIFEPFFTTKTKDKGTGLGLPIVHRIIDRAGGFLHVASELGKGTSVMVYLPRVASDARPSDEAPA